MDTDDTPEALMEKINSYLPEDIGVISVEEVPERFHSRLNAKSKTYRYRVLNLSLVHIYTEKDIHLYINSPGGSVTAGMAIYDTMQLSLIHI